MWAEIVDNGYLVVHSESATERFALSEWYKQNPVSEGDGVRLELKCLKPDKEKQNV